MTRPPVEPAELASALRQILAQCEHIVAGGEERFLSEDLDAQILRLAAERLIITLQAVLDDLPQSFVEQHPELPFAAVRGMRHRLAHGYDDINAAIVWRTLSGRLPHFVRTVLRGLEAVDA